MKVAAGEAAEGSRPVQLATYVTWCCDPAADGAMMEAWVVETVVGEPPSRKTVYPVSA